MSKVYTKDHIEKRLETTITDMQRKVKEQRMTQAGWKGYDVLPSRASDPTGAPDGAIYYNTVAHTVKVKLNGSWKTVTTS